MKMFVGQFLHSFLWDQIFTSTVFSKLRGTGTSTIQSLIRSDALLWKHLDTLFRMLRHWLWHIEDLVADTCAQTKSFKIWGTDTSKLCLSVCCCTSLVGRLFLNGFLSIRGWSSLSDDALASRRQLLQRCTSVTSFSGARAGSFVVYSVLRLSLSFSRFLAHARYLTMVLTLAASQTATTRRAMVSGIMGTSWSLA